MELSTQLFAILLVSGLMLVGAEVFVPGGVLGLLGGTALVIAAIMGFWAFGPVAGSYLAIGIVILLGIVIFLWIKIFPSTRMGKRMTVANDMSTFKATEDGLQELVGKEGEATSALRPAGFAVFDGRRVDVVTQGGMIERGDRIRVVEVEGNRVVVERIG